MEIATQKVVFVYSVDNVYANIQVKSNKKFLKLKNGTKILLRL